MSANAVNICIGIHQTVLLHTCTRTSVSNSRIIVGDVDDVTAARAPSRPGVGVTTTGAVVESPLPDGVAAECVTALRRPGVTTSVLRST